MDTDSDVRGLVELIFGKKSTLLEEMAAPSSIPSSLRNDDFLQKLAHVLKYRLTFLVSRWEKKLSNHLLKSFHSHTDYLSYVMLACLYENKCNENIFDSFISVCVLIPYLSEVFLSKVAVDFRDMNPDIFMVFYRKEMNRPFRKRKYFYRLVEYIRDHKYNKWLNDSTASAPGEEISYLDLEETRKDYVNYCASENLSLDTLSEMQAKGRSLARDLLSSTSVKLPDLPSEYELIQRLVDYNRKREKTIEAEKVETTLTMETSHGEASLNSDSKTDLRDPQEDAAWHENIIEAVIRHNHSTDSGQEISKSQIHEKANDILKHLESKIKSLIEVLDECNE